MNLNIPSMKDAVERNLALLEPEADIVPTVVTHGPDGIAVTEMVFDISDDHDREHLADLLSATIIIDRADSAMFTMMAWSVTAEVEPEGDLAGHPDRREIVMIAHLTGDGDAMFAAPIHRSSGSPTVGEWAEYSAGSFDGRLYAGMRMGLHLVSDMPESISAAIEATDRDAAVTAVARALMLQRQARREEFYRRN